MPTGVTVAVVVKDRRQQMSSCLTGLLSQRGVARYDVVVVDNLSTDGTYEDLLRQQAAGRIRVLREPGGLGRIRNVAVSAAETEIVAFTDSDCVPDPDWLHRLLAPFDDPAITVVQGTTLPLGPDGDPFPATQRITELSGRFEACNIAYRREALIAAGGFDEAIGQFGEDTAAGWRVLSCGGRAAFVRDAVVRHTVTYPGLRWWLRRAWSYRAWPALARDHPGLRHDLLWNGVFLRRRSAAYDAAAAGVALAAGRRRFTPLLLATPYLAMVLPRQASRSAANDTGKAMMIDTVIALALVTGSLRARTVVL